MKFTAHKIILSSCSNTFKFILQGNTNANPLLYLGGISSVNLGYILDYVYHGEINLYQEQLDGFLESAQKLEIEGLMGPENTELEIKGLMGQEITDQDCHLEAKAEGPIDEYYQYQPTANQKIKGDVNAIPVNTRRSYLKSTSDVGRIDVSSLTQEEIEDKINSLFQKKDGVWTCLACNFTSTKKDNTRKHVETHLDGLSYPCNLCSKVFRLRKSLANHTTLHNKNLF